MVDVPSSSEDNGLHGRILALVTATDTEQEIKIPVAELTMVRQRLAASGGVLVHPLQLEENAVLDDAADSMRGSGRLLRVRDYAGTVVLTYKGPATFVGPVKSRLELETCASNPRALVAILGELGFTPRRRYQKLREVWRLTGVSVALDKTPLGCFVELEGAAALLSDLAVDLGLDPSAAVPQSYQELWARHRELHPDAATDMVFAADALARVMQDAAGPPR